MPSGYILSDGTFVPHVDYPEEEKIETYPDSPCGRAMEQQAKVEKESQLPPAQATSESGEI